MTTNLSRRSFLKGVAASTASVAALALTGCSNEEVSSKDVFKAGTYESEQSTDFATIKVICTFTTSALEDVKYETIKTSDSDYFALKEAEVKEYIAKVIEKGSPVEIDGISGATLCTTALKNGIAECYLQALDVEVAQKEAVAASCVSVNPQDYDYTSNTIADMSKTKIFEPWKFGSLTVPNRIVKSAAGSHYLPGITTEEIVGDYVNWTKGGVGFIWAEDFANLYSLHPALYKVLDRSNAPLKELTDAVHAEGGLIGYQISQMGAQYSGFNPAEHPQFAGAEAQDLTKQEINEVIEEFADTARFLKEKGFDAVELNAAGNNIAQAFLSRNRNKRTDEYGCSTVENRARFVTDVVSKIKEYCGADYPVQVLINGIEDNDASIGVNEVYTTVAENIELCKVFEKCGADSIEVRIGPSTMHVAEFAADLWFTGRGINGTAGTGAEFDFSKQFEGKLIANHSGCGLMLNIAKEIKANLSIPLGTVTYIDPAHAPDFFVKAMDDGCADFYCMTRPLQADPFYVKKLKENRIDEIAPCTRCMHCHFDYTEDGAFYEHCRVNAWHMRAFHEEMPEGYEPTPVKEAKNVMVIGGGPAGMEAARIAAQRGHKVTLYEKSANLGGMLDFAYTVKGPHENLDYLKNYLIRQQEVNGVSVVTGKEVTADFIKEQNPDAVILAAGGLRESLPFSSKGKTSVFTMDDVISSAIGNDVVIYGSNLQAIDAAMYLMDQGKNVTIVNPYAEATLGKGHSSWVKTFELPAIKKRVNRIWNNATIKAVNDGSITINCVTGIDTTIACDSVIDARDMVSNTSLLDGLTCSKVAVGDASSPFNIAEAIHSGNIAGRNI